MSEEQGEKDAKAVDGHSKREDSAEDDSMPLDEELPYPEGAFPEGAPIPKLDFITFVLSLAHSTSCHLGVSPNPETKTCEENFPMARETIDILGMLQEKTQGNLTGEEERILHEIVYDLRMAYVQAIKK